MGEHETGQRAKERDRSLDAENDSGWTPPWLMHQRSLSVPAARDQRG